MKQPTTVGPGTGSLLGLALLSLVGPCSEPAWASEALELRRGARDLAQPVGFVLVPQAGSALSGGQVVMWPGVDVLRITSPGAEVPATPARSSGGTFGGGSADWSNFGGTAGRNSRSAVGGPGVASLLWSGGRPSIVAWPPMIMGNRMFTVRQTDSPPPNGTGVSPVVATNLQTGGELWAVHLPLNAGDWVTWIAGARDGRVYASRSGNGASVAAKMYALDAASGAVLWVSADTTTAGAYDGVVFAPNGDLIVASFTSILRINAVNGGTVWSAPRLCRVSGSCGAALHGQGVYVADAGVGFDNVVARHDLASGARQYTSQPLPGFTQQDMPFVGPDGTVYFSRTQSNVATDYLYAFDDTGSALTTRWAAPSAWMTSSTQAVRADGSVYTMAPGYQLVRRDAATGNVLASAPPGPVFDHGVRMALDSGDKLYVSEGFSAMRAYTAALAPIFGLSVPNLNVGGPILGGTGTMIVTGIGTDVRAVVPVELLSFDLE